MAMLVFETLLRAMPSPPATLDQARVVCCKGHPSARRAAATWNLYQWRAANADAGLFSVDDCLREWLRVDRQGSSADPPGMGCPLPDGTMLWTAGASSPDSC